MKTKLLFLLAVIFVSASCTQSKTVSEKQKIIKVGVFDGHGGAQTCVWEATEAIRLDSGMSVRTITSADIALGVLDSLDAIIIPGGGGSRQYLNIGAENQRRIKEFVSKGKGAVGICAGAYLFSDTPDYSCFALNGAKAIDIEHDNRGHGVAKFTLTEEGKQLFPEIATRDTNYVVYYEGPVFVKADNSSVSYETFAVMQSDVHEEGDAPSNMTNNKPFFIANKYGEGRVFSSIAHPEATPGMQWMIPRMIRWVTNSEIVPYSANTVRPDIFNREILFTKEMLKKESGLFKEFLYGSAQEKIVALDWLQECASWDAKRWIQGLVYDSDPNVRLRAVRYISETGNTHYLRDVEAACKNEADPQIKAEMQKSLDFMLSICKTRN